MTGLARMAVVWFPHLMTDVLLRKQPALRDKPLVLVTMDRGRRVVRSFNEAAGKGGVSAGMTLADCQAIVAGLHVEEFDEGARQRAVYDLACWCIRYSPVVAVDERNGLVLDTTGCTHLWGGEQAYIDHIGLRLAAMGFRSRVALADTIGAAWAVCRYGKPGTVIPPSAQSSFLSPLPAGALRLGEQTCERLRQLGIGTIGQFMHMPRTVLRRRFGQEMLTRLDQALGQELEFVEPVKCPEPFEERLPCLEPVATAAGIEQAIETLVSLLCARLSEQSKGARQCILTCYRVDRAEQSIGITTSRASRNARHLCALFTGRIAQIEPGLGIELFVMKATVTEEQRNSQEAMWLRQQQDEQSVAELLDRISARVGPEALHRYLPEDRYWPERSYREAQRADEEPVSRWPTHAPRPVHLLPTPELIEVTAPIPDYPPMLFRHKGKLHTVKKADGPERIEQEWWEQSGHYRDYYCVEDESGARYWLFRSGDYYKGDPKWFVHGYFA